MTSVATGQLILGTDKRNPLFTVYAQEDPGQLHVYYGLEFLEGVSADRNAPDFKRLVGRLYNAGLSRRVLQETFQVDRKTIQRWGRALRCPDAQELVRRLAGRRASRKLTPEIKAYVRARWPALSRAGTYGIGQRRRAEIASVFGVKLSQETLRPLVGKLKRGDGLAGAAASAEGPATTADPLPPPDESTLENQGVDAGPEETPCGCSSAGLAAGPTAGTEPPASVLGLESAPQTLWCDHAGVLLFAPSLLGIAQVLHPPEARFKQWLASLLLGALNIEQTKFLNWEDLSRLLGSVVPFPHPQRQELERVATEASGQALARFNARQLEWPAERALTGVVDRAIFGKEVFAQVLENPALHLITWEKGYPAQSWPPAGGVSGSRVIERARHRADDIRSHHLEYLDRPWPKEERLRQLVVQATHPKGRTIQPESGS